MLLPTPEPLPSKFQHSRLPTQADKIRELAARGMTTKEIIKTLGARANYVSRVTNNTQGLRVLVKQIEDIHFAINRLGLLADAIIRMPEKEIIRRLKVLRKNRDNRILGEPYDGPGKPTLPGKGNQE